MVEVADHEVGTVRKIGARTATVETRDDIIIFVPNSKLIGENVVNWSHVERKARFHVKVGVAYGSDTELVREILFKVVDEHARILKTPKPIVRFIDFGNSSLDFDVLFWSRDLIRIEDIKSDVRFAIDKMFPRARRRDSLPPARPLDPWRARVWTASSPPSPRMATRSNPQKRLSRGGGDAGAKQIETTE